MLDTSIDFTYFSFVMDIDNAMRRINFFREELEANEVHTNSTDSCDLPNTSCSDSENGNPLDGGNNENEINEAITKLTNCQKKVFPYIH